MLYSSGFVVIVQCIFRNKLINGTQGQIVGAGRSNSGKNWRHEKFLRGKKIAPENSVSTDHFQTTADVLAFDWTEQKILCTILPDRRTAELKSLPCVLMLQCSLSGSFTKVLHAREIFILSFVSFQRRREIKFGQTGQTSKEP